MNESQTSNSQTSEPQTGEPRTSEPQSAQSHSFQAEVAELLNLMVHSVYSETDVFLRELVSNASDACDKLRYEAIARPELLAGADRLAIRIAPDAKARTLAISDTGIGMGRQEMIDNLGTIARSGTKDFMKDLAAAKDAPKDGQSLIGQFGVGFYAAFMVADRIEVTSRRAGSGEAWVWRSQGGAGFEVVPASEEQAARVPRGTEVVLHLKERRYFSVNETGLTLLEALKQPRSFEELVAEILREYEVSPEVARETTREFLTQCLDSAVVEQTP